MWQPTHSSNELYHHGILGMKWGVRRYQNPDGSLTAAGKKRYGANTIETIGSAKGLQRRMNDVDQAMAFNKRKHAEGHSQATGYERKAQAEAEKRWTNQKKLRKYNNEVLKGSTKMHQAESQLKKGEKEIEMYKRMVKEKGYTLKSKEVQRSVVKGSDVLASVGGSILSATVSAVLHAPVTFYYLPANRAPGTRYKVRETKEQREAAKEERKKKIK